MTAKILIKHTLVAQMAHLRGDITTMLLLLGSRAIELIVWRLKGVNGRVLHIKWKIIKKVKPGRVRRNYCKLCQEEKLTIAAYPNKDELLNERSEVLSKCSHSKYLLCLYEPG